MKISSAEKQKGRLTKKNLELAVRAVKETGYVTLERVMSDKWVEDMRAVSDDFLRKALRGKKQKKILIKAEDIVIREMIWMKDERI